MQLGYLIVVVGVGFSVVGLLIEAVAMAGIASYRVRRVLPVASPITLQGIGCACFCAGWAIAALGAGLAR